MLEYAKFGVSRHLGQAALERMKIDVHKATVGGLVYELSTSILAEKIPPAQFTESTTVTYATPATPWDHFKQNHCAAWWLRWFKPPVMIEHQRYVTLTVTIDGRWTYPQASIQLPECGDPVLATTSAVSWDIQPNDGR